MQDERQNLGAATGGAECCDAAHAEAAANPHILMEYQIVGRPMGDFLVAKRKALAQILQCGMSDRPLLLLPCVSKGVSSLDLGRAACTALFFGSSRESGEGGSASEKDVGVVAEALGAALGELDLVVDALEDAGA